jgi:hypothetical protein
MPIIDTTLNKNIDSLLKKTESLIIQTDSVYKYVKKQDNIPKMHDNGYGVYVSFLFILCTIILIRYNKKIDSLIYKKFTSEKVKERNIIWALLWLIDSAILFGALMCLGIIHNPKDFWFSHADILLAFASLIALIGAIWAVFARIDAEKAFKKSEQTLKKSQETLEAIGNASFPFSEILNSDKFPSFFQIPDNTISPKVESKTTLSLYLGFPCVGFLFIDKHKFKTTPEQLFFNLTEYLYQLKSRLARNNEPANQLSKLVGVKLNICVFSKNKVQQMISSQGTPINSPDGRNIIDDFYTHLEELKAFSKIDSNTGKPVPDEYGNQIVIKFGEIVQNNKDSQSIFKEDFDENEKLRFISFYNPNLTPLPSKAYVWIVPKPLTNDKGKVQTFDSSAFQTNDSKFIEVLESVFS